MPTAQLSLTVVLDGIGVPAVKEVQGRTRCEEAAIQFPRGLLDAAGDVHHVAVEHDAAPVNAHLAKHHRPGVQGAAHSRGDPEGRLEPRRSLGQYALDLEETGQRTGFGAAVGDLPGNDDLVTHVLVDFAVLVGDRIGDQGKDAVKKTMNGKLSDLLGDARRSDNIHEKKEALLHARLVIAAQQEVTQGAAAYQAADLQEKDDDEHDNKGEDDRHGREGLRGLGIAHAAEHHHLAHTEQLDAQNDRAVYHPLDQNGDDQGGLLDALPPRRSHAKYFHQRDYGSDDKPVDGADHATDQQFAPAGEADQAAVDDAHDNTGTHDPGKPPEAHSIAFTHRTKKGCSHRSTLR